MANISTSELRLERIIQPTVGFQEGTATRRSDSEFASGITFRGVDSRQGIQMPQREIAKSDFRLEPRKLTMNLKCALHEVSPASPRPAMRKRLTSLDRQRLAFNEYLEAQPVRPRHEPRERHRAG